MEELFRVSVPFVAPTLNKFYSQTMHWTKRSSDKNKWREYFELISDTVPVVSPDKFPLLIVSVAHHKDKRRRDSDNSIVNNKFATDALVHTDKMPDDSVSYVAWHACAVSPDAVKEPYTEIIVISLGSSPNPFSSDITPS